MNVFASSYNRSLFLPFKNITNIPHRAYKIIAHTATKANPRMCCVRSTTFMYRDFVLCQPFQFVESHDSPKMFTWD